MDNPQQPRQNEDPKKVEQRERRLFDPWEQAFNRDFQMNDREFDY